MRSFAMANAFATDFAICDDEYGEAIRNPGRKEEPFAGHVLRLKSVAKVCVSSLGESA
jgi:hypothetical protein